MGFSPDGLWFNSECTLRNTGVSVLSGRTSYSKKVGVYACKKGSYTIAAKLYEYSVDEDETYLLDTDTAEIVVEPPLPPTEVPVPTKTPTTEPTAVPTPDDTAPDRVGTPTVRDVRGSGSLIVSWSARYDGGSRINKYYMDYWARGTPPTMRP